MLPSKLVDELLAETVNEIRRVRAILKADRYLIGRGLGIRSGYGAVSLDNYLSWLVLRASCLTTGGHIRDGLPDVGDRVECRIEEDSIQLAEVWAFRRDRDWVAVWLSITDVNGRNPIFFGTTDQKYRQNWWLEDERPEMGTEK